MLVFLFVLLDTVVKPRGDSKK
ncbi:MAG: hypothetical protein ACEY3D_02730 [Rickettsia sp.]